VMDPHNPRTLYAGTWDAEIGGPVSVFTSTDAGSTWNASVSGFPGAGANGQITSLAIDPFNSNVIFAGTDRGLLRSTDACAHWNILTGVPGTFIPSIVFDSQTSGTLYVSGSGGVWKSVDGGANWELPGTGTPTNAVLAIDPQNPKTLYAAGSFPKML